MKNDTSAPHVGREVVANKVRSVLNLSSDKEAHNVVNAVTDAIVTTISENITTNGFTLKLPGFGKFSIRHKQGKMRKIPLTGETKMTADKRKVKFTPLSEIRGLERVTAATPTAAASATTEATATATPAQA